jgi:N-glycosylase/DNA lyase
MNTLEATRDTGMFIPVRNADFCLGTCLSSGQAFGWQGVTVDHCEWWVGTIREIAFAISQSPSGLKARSAWVTDSDDGPPGEADSKDLLMRYLALQEDVSFIRATFPREDEFLAESIRYCPGLRILRQDPWECLAGFILSSTKKIVHIQQIWRKVSERWGSPMRIPLEVNFMVHHFPRPEVLAGATERELRDCGMGFRAPWLLGAARRVADGSLRMEELRSLELADARARLMELDGVGRKIADCVLLFSLGKEEAFPVDTWISQVLEKVYFSRRRKKLSPEAIAAFAREHFGSHAGHAQQFLFHYSRLNPERIRRGGLRR